MSNCLLHDKLMCYSSIYRVLSFICDRFVSVNYVGGKLFVILPRVLDTIWFLSCFLETRTRLVMLKDWRYSESGCQLWDRRLIVWQLVNRSSKNIHRRYNYQHYLLLPSTWYALDLWLWKHILNISYIEHREAILLFDMFLVLFQKPDVISISDGFALGYLVTLHFHWRAREYLA